MIRRIAAVLLSLLVLGPSGAFAQSSPAGIVTTLEGNVTARRVALPGPVPLKFKDDVFMQDTVTTGDKSLARMLLGGKAVVTVRERSVVTITEVPGRSTIDLDSGKFALAVAREKMRPGEEIQIRTPNAVAGVRGTVVITEVNRQSAQAGGGAPAVLTTFYVLRGTITAQQLDPGTKQPIGTPLNIGTMQSYSQAGNAAGRVAPVPQDKVGEITAGLQPQGPKGGRDAGAEQAKNQALQTALSLVNVLTSTTQASAILAPTPPITTTTTSIQSQTQTPINVFQASDSTILTSTSSNAGSGASTSGGAKSFDQSFTSTSTSPLITLNGASLTQAGNFVDIKSGAAVSIAGPLATFINSTLNATGALFALTNGSLTSTTQSALFSLDPTTITAGDALFALNGGTMTLAGALLTDVNGKLSAPDYILRMQGGASLVDSGSGALIQLSGTTVGVTGALSMTNATMSLAGPLFTATGLLPGSGGGNGPIVALSGSTLTSTAAGALVQFTSTSAQVPDSVLRVSDGSVMTLAGPFLSGSNTTFKVGDPTSNTFALVSIRDGSQVTSTSASPFLSFTNGSVDTAGPMLSLRRSTASTPSQLTLSGPLLSGTNATFNSTSLGFGATFSTSASACCDMFLVSQGALLKGTSSQALIQLTGSTVTGNDTQSGGNFFQVSDSFTGAPSGEVVSPSSVTLTGPLLASTDSTITSLFSLLRVQRSSLKSTSTSPLISISGGSVTLGGTNPIDSSLAVGNLLQVIASNSSGQAASAASVTLAGPLANLTNTTLSTGISNNIISVLNGATLTGTGTDALLKLQNTSLTGINLLVASGFGAAGGTTQASISLAGPVLSATSSTLSLANNVIGIFAGGVLTSTTTSPLVQLTGGSLTAGTVSANSSLALLQINGVAGGTSPSLATLSGPVLSTSSSANTTIPGALLATFNGGQLVVNNSTDALFAFNGGTHSFGTGSSTDRDSALILTGLSTQTATEDVSFTARGCDGPCSPQDITFTTGSRKPVQHNGALIEATGGTQTTNKIARIDTALLEATAPILSLKSGATMTVSNDAIDLIQQAKVSITAVNPLVRLDASTLTINNGALIAARSGSLITVAGDAIMLSGGATLNINNGPLVLVQTNSGVKVTGALINFGTGGGTINITNNFCVSSCATVGGLRFAVANGALASNVNLGANTIVGSGTINYGSVTSAAIRLDGTGARIMTAGGSGF